MAKIGLAFGGAIAGFLLGGPLGAQIGFTIGGVLGSVLFPGKLPPGPRVNDLVVTSASNGAPIPIVFNQSRIAGNIIWAPPIIETSKKKSVKGGPKQVTYSYTANFAVAFCEGPATLGRIWFDSKIVYDPTAGTASVTAASESGNIVTIQSTLNPSIGGQVTIAGVGSGYNGKFKVLLSSPVNFTYYCPTSGLSPLGAGGTASIAPPKYTAPVIYSGSELQNADPTIQGAIGAANCSAFRGLCYAVWTNFPLSDFGNRIPNVRGEVNATTSKFGNGGLSFDTAIFGSATNLPNKDPWPVTSVANASGGNTTYTGTFNGGTPAVPQIGATVVIAGFLNQVNNGNFVVQAGSGAGTLVLNNPNGVAETATATASVAYPPISGAPNIPGEFAIIFTAASQGGRANNPPQQVPGSASFVLTGVSASGVYAFSSFTGRRPTPGVTTVSISGFANSINNGTFVMTAITGGPAGGTFTVNGSRANETHAATAVVCWVALDFTSSSLLSFYIVHCPTSDVITCIETYTASPQFPVASITVVQALAFFGAGGSFPQYSPLASRSGSNADNYTLGVFTPSGGNAVLVTLELTDSGFGGFSVPCLYTVTDDHGQVYTKIIDRFQTQGSGGNLSGAQFVLFLLQNPVSLPTTLTFVQGPGSPAQNSIGSTTNVIQLSNLTPVLVPGQPWGLADIVSNISQRCGLLATDIDVTQLQANPASSPIVPVPAPGGYVISRPTTGQNALKPLALAFFFDGVESGGVIRFVPRGQAPVTINIPESDLGWFKDKFKLTEQIGMAQDLPREFQVLFNDKALDYQQNKQHKRRKTRIVHTKQETVIELPMTIDATTARQIAEKALFLAYLERKPFDINLWKSLYLLFDPTDVIQFVYEGLTFQLRVVRLQIGVDFTVAISGVNENASGYLSALVGSSGTGVTPGQVRTLPDTVLFLLDIPLLRDGDSNPSGSGYYLGMSSISPATWPGASLQKSSNDVDFAEETTSSTATNYGVASNVIGAPRSPWTWDTVNKLTVFMVNGTLSGTSDLNVLNGANVLMYGSECLQYVNSIQNSDGSFTISRLLRGRRGTEIYCGTHGPSETVIDLNNPGIVRQATSLANLQVVRYFRPVTFGADISTITSQLMTNTGQDLKPYAPTSIAGVRDGSGNLTITWIRRTRIGGDWLNGIGTVPLSEAAESYDVEVISGSTVIRTFAGLSSPSVVYTLAQQTVDFGGAKGKITVNVYQNSATIGRGFKATAII